MMRGAKLFAVLASLASFAVASRVVSDPVPLAKDLDEFRKIQSEVARTPQGGAIMFVTALLEYASGNDEFMKLALLEDDLVGGSLSAMDRYRLRRVKEFMARAYVDGTTPDDCYQLPSDDEIALAFRPQDKHVGSVASGRYKVFVWSGDASLTARPMTLKRNQAGLWKAVEFSSLVLPLVRDAESLACICSAPHSLFRLSPASFRPDTRHACCEDEGNFVATQFDSRAAPATPHRVGGDPPARNPALPCPPFPFLHHMYNNTFIPHKSPRLAHHHNARGPRHHDARWGAAREGGHVLDMRSRAPRVPRRWRASPPAQPDRDTAESLAVVPREHRVRSDQVSIQPDRRTLKVFVLLKTNFSSRPRPPPSRLPVVHTMKIDHIIHVRDRVRRLSRSRGPSLSLASLWPLAAACLTDPCIAPSSHRRFHLSRSTSPTSGPRRPPRRRTRATCSSSGASRRTSPRPTESCRPPRCRD